MAKQIEEKHELIKFIKSLYSDEIQLNFDDYFYVQGTDSSVCNIYFPANTFYYIDGQLDLSTCPSLNSWLQNKTAKIDNDKLDALRKRKMGDFDTLAKGDNYEISFIDGEKFTLVPYLYNNFTLKNIEFIDSFTFEEGYFNDKNIVTVYMKDGKITTEPTSDIIFDSPIKNLKILFKKSAEYKIYVSDTDSDGFRYLMIEAKGKICMLRQYFRVIG